MESEDIFSIIKKLSVPIIESVSSEQIENFKPYYERYYENKYCTTFNTDTENNDFILRFHTNKLVLLSIASGHDIIRNKQIIESINFSIKGQNMSDINLSGKKKTGAKKLNKNSIVCYLKCKDNDKEYPVYSCIPGSLIEINQFVVENPQLLITDYKALGYIAVLNPKRQGPNVAPTIEKAHSLLSEEEYETYRRNQEKLNNK
ncbi:hypothetical protein ABEB36_005381 [Hypothenemus hampei]|uniref:Actin-binding transcription modulator n=1 Tax=Hypothenemus hampei TaxID=57062 RepID=A0ABD1EY20_HYPHA